MKRLFLLLIIIGVLIAVEPIGRLIKNTVGNIVYRGAFVTGIITADNGDKSYAVEIGESGKSRPKIFTLSPNPDLKIGDKARILYRGGNKEDPILLAPTIVEEETMAGNIFVYYQAFDGTNHIRAYTSDGTFIIQWAMPTGYYEANCIVVDSNGYMYVNYGSIIVKRDNKAPYGILVTNSADGCEAIAIGADGYLYCREWYGNNVIVKRNLSDLESVDSINISNGSLYGLILDSDGYIYFCNSTTNNMEKWIFQNGGQVTTHSITTQSADDSGLCMAGNLIGMGAGFRDGTYELGALSMNKALTQDEQEFSDIDCGYVYETPSSIDNNFLFVGDDWTNTNLVLKKYDSSKNLLWSVNVTEIGTVIVDNAAVAAYPF
jgi:hypothetical protein